MSHEKPYDRQTMNKFRGTCKTRILNLCEARHSVLARTLNAVGRDDEIAEKLDVVISRYDDLLKTERELFRYFFHRAQPEEPTP